LKPVADLGRSAACRKGNAVIELDKVSYGFGGTALFSQLSLNLTAGSFHFLTGPSGAGKTTLLRLCYADLRARSGKVRLFGQDAATLDRDAVALARRRIGVVHQNCEFLDHLTIAENIALPLVVSGRADEAAQNLPELLNWVGLGAQANQLPPELSGGERQRAALARAVIMSPDVIIADEPTGNVDWEMSQRLMQLLAELNKMGKTILIATHDLHMIRAMNTDVRARVLRLRDGQ
jgi:cell division transport system ATP-binding protein